MHLRSIGDLDKTMKKAIAHLVIGTMISLLTIMAFREIVTPTKLYISGSLRSVCVITAVLLGVVGGGLLSRNFKNSDT